EPCGTRDSVAADLFAIVAGMGRLRGGAVGDGGRAAWRQIARIPAGAELALSALVAALGRRGAPPAFRLVLDVLERTVAAHDDMDRLWAHLDLAASKAVAAVWRPRGTELHTRFDDGTVPVRL